MWLYIKVSDEHTTTNFRVEMSSVMKLMGLYRLYSLSHPMAVISQYSLA
jgi:hypothetical protein